MACAQTDGVPERREPAGLADSETSTRGTGAPRRARYGYDNKVSLRFKDGTTAVAGSDGKWYVEGSDGQPDLSQPVELVNDRMERVRKGNDSRVYIVGDDGKLDLGRPVELVEGRWVEVTPGQEVQVKPFGCKASPTNDPYWREWRTLPSLRESSRETSAPKFGRRQNGFGVGS